MDLDREDKGGGEVPLLFNYMKTKFLTLLPLAVMMVSVACSTVNPTVYTKGAVQSARSKKNHSASVSLKANTLPTVCIMPFVDLRNRPEDIGRLWMCAVPGLSLFSCWEKPDWLNWDTTYNAGYKPFSLDLSEVVQDELQHAGVSSAIVCENEPCAASLILDGTINELSLTLYPHFWGTSYIIGEPLGLLGIPMGSWEVAQKISFRLLEKSSGRVVWQKTYDTNADGLMAMYYGKNPLSHGYPYQQLLEPILKDVVTSLKNYVKDDNVAIVTPNVSVSITKPVAATPTSFNSNSIVQDNPKLPSTVIPSNQTVDTAAQLKKLKELKDTGLLTDEEFEAKRKELVDQL
jgi:hypothetical protein